MSTPTNTALHWLAGAFDANASYSWIRRADKAPTLRLTIIHGSPTFLQQVRQIARCGNLTRRHNSGNSQWQVEGLLALRLAGELNAYLLRPIPTTAPEEV